MTMSKTKNYSKRAAREKNAHEDHDILGENKRLKEKYFQHTVLNKYFKAFNSRPDQILQPLDGKKILEIGCGLGDRSIAYSLLGATVTGLDISEKYINIAKSKITEHREGSPMCSFITMDCHNLEFEDNTFDVVCGDAILHHLDLDIVLKEANRVLKPGGIAVFIEPLAGNPFLKAFRFLTPSARTIDERPLTSHDLDHISKNWIVRSEYYGILCAPASALTSLLKFLGPDNFLIDLAAKIEMFLNKFNALVPFNQFVLLNLAKKQH